MLKNVLLYTLLFGCTPTKKLADVLETYTGSIEADCIMYVSDSVYSRCRCDIYVIDLLDRKGNTWKSFVDTVCYVNGKKGVGRPLR